MVVRMAATLLRALPLLRVRLLHQHHFQLTAGSITRRPWCSAADSTSTDKNVDYLGQINTGLSGKEAKYSRLDDSDFRKWKEKEAEILEDIEPIICLTKEILHSDRYMDGECLTAEDEKAVVDKLLSYHPHSEDKIGRGIDSIMVDRHPQFKRSRCLFVVRTDGGWIDFSYLKCLRAYIQDEYPSYGERFIKEHFKRSSG